METGSLTMHRVNKVKEEIYYINSGKTQVRNYDFTNGLGTFTVTLFMIDEPGSEIVNDDDDKIPVDSRWALDNVS